MTEIDYRTIQALARCSFQPGSWPKRFIRDLSAYSPEKELTEKQQAALARIAWHFRRQLAQYGIVVETRPADVGPDPQHSATQRELEQLKAWEEGKPL